MTQPTEQEREAARAMMREWSIDWLSCDPEEMETDIAQALADHREASIATVRVALEPFARAARQGEISGTPPFHFVDASDYERARRALSPSPEDSTDADSQ